jgi:hypothetical protein
MFTDYGRSASTCIDEASCLAPSPDDKTVKLYKISDPNTGGKPLTIGKISSYTGVPRIIFVDATIIPSSSTREVLDINTNFTIGNDTALIFVVKGDVKIDYGVTNVSGVFLVDGQFSSGKRTASVSGTAEAGKFATISTGRDGFSRIAYLSGDNVRFIKCKDLTCTDRDYGYVAPATSNEVKSINMTLYEDANGIDYPKIVVGMRDATGNSTVRFISCTAENCLDSDPIVSTYQGARDPDILINDYYKAPSYIFGYGTESMKPVNIFNCADKNCPSITGSTYIIDGSSVSDKGNEVSYSIDKLNSLFPQTVATYVDRTTGNADLWFAKYYWGVTPGTGCSAGANAFGFWSCKKLASNIALYPGSISHPTNGKTFIGYVDSSVTKEVKTLVCTDNSCSTTSTTVQDCNGGTACLGQPYVSVETINSLMFIVYNVKNTSNNSNEVKLAYCVGSWAACQSSVWTKTSISNNPSWTSVSGDAKSWNQAIALGRATEVGYPRIVFVDRTDNSLIYAHCKTATCSDVDYKLLDSGSPIVLPDKTLTINGAVYAFGQQTGGKALNLQRDLLATNTTQPAEIFNLDPKYFYILRNVIKAPEYIQESAP